MQGGVLWSMIVFGCFIGDVCAGGETNAMIADVCVPNLFGVDILGPCMAKGECANVLFNYYTSQSASETIQLLFPL